MKDRYMRQGKRAHCENREKTPAELLEEAAAKKLTFSETRTSLGERAYSVSGCLSTDEPEILIPAHYNKAPVVRIENRAFCGNLGLMDISFPESLVSVGVFAFAFCGNLCKIILPDGLTSLGGRAFYGCGNLKEIKLGNRLKAVRNGLFVGCKSITEIELPDTVTGIGSDAFAYCENLETLTIGSGVTVIGEKAFTECNRLKEICYHGTREDWNKIKKDLSNASALHGALVRCSDGEIKPSRKEV